MRSPKSVFTIREGATQTRPESPPLLSNLKGTVETYSGDEEMNEETPWLFRALPALLSVGIPQAAHHSL